MVMTVPDNIKCRVLEMSIILNNRPNGDMLKASGCALLPVAERYIIMNSSTMYVSIANHEACFVIFLCTLSGNLYCILKNKQKNGSLMIFGPERLNL